jgi:large subunit ribosomal protein L10
MRRVERVDRRRCPNGRADVGLIPLDRRERVWASGRNLDCNRVAAALAVATRREEATVDRTQKEAFVAEMHEILNGSSTVVVTHYNGLDVARISDLRRRMGEAGATFRVIKNRLTKLALKGTPYEALDELFVGPTAIAFSDDPVAPAKVAVEFARTNNALVVLGGGMGERRLDLAAVRALAALPSLDELRKLKISKQ